jgi:hypothetical protein
MSIAHYQATVQSYSIKTKSFQNVANFKYLGTMATNQNYVHKEIKSILNLGHACYHAVQNL